jgi:3-methyl-2-oxobutanoate hydroxymethyltransferase
MDTKITIAELLEAKRKGKKITAVSCYDYTTARLVSEAGIEMILVGDSAAQVMLGFDTTLPATMDFMVAITAAARRAAPNVCLVADMPFLSYQAGIEMAVKNAGRFFTDCGVQMVKIEASEAYLDVVKAAADAGMAVMGHIGIRPQVVNLVGRLKSQATTAEQAEQLIKLADKLVDAGAVSLLLEGTAAEVTEIITKRFAVPVIGCGSGRECDGQILIAPDILGLTTTTETPKFAKSYCNMAAVLLKAMHNYSREVKSGKYPDYQHSYHMKAGEYKKLKTLLKDVDIF